MGLVKIIDIETKNEYRLEDNHLHVDFPKIVYRNASTKELDKKFGDLNPLPNGSSFQEGDLVFPIFLEPAQIFGFYVGLEKKDIHKLRQIYFPTCELKHTIEMVNYQGKEIVFPIDFK